MRGEFVDVAGSRLYYYAAGTRVSREPVIFVHGFPSSSYLWRDVVRQMSPGHRIVVLDQLGFGRSDRPLSMDRSVLSVLAHAGRLRALMDALGIESACLVGHAMGGAVAQSLALSWPARVSRLGLVNSVAFDAWPQRAARLARTLCAIPQIGRALGVPFLAGLVHGSLLPGFVEKVRARHSLDHYLHAFTARLGVDVLAAQLRAMRDNSVAALGERLGTIGQPTSVIWGVADPFLSVRVGARLRDAIPGASLELIAEAGHFSPEDAPDHVASAIEALLRR